jgi:2-desacetyl-2-hydroxyethyl bacteriochlorophyllide A dehydrogenase
MKQLTFLAKGAPALCDAPDPIPGPDRMILRTLWSALSNGTERALLMGETYNKGQSYPVHPGYQAICRVVAVGDEVTRFAPGDTVFAGTFGAHAEFQAVHEEDLVVKLPADSDHRALAFLAVAAVSWNNIGLTRILPQERVLVIGAGLIGQFAVQAARIAGGSVALASRSADRLRAAQAAGPVEILETGDLVQIHDAGPFAVVAECSGAENLDAIIGDISGPRLIAPRGGRLALIAGRDRVSYDCVGAQCRALTIYHCTHFLQQHLEEVVRLFDAGLMTSSPFLRDVVPARQIAHCYERLRDAPGELFGALFDWRDGV